MVSEPSEGQANEGHGGMCRIFDDSVDDPNCMP
jgi:hypothetical protein